MQIKNNRTICERLPLISIVTVCLNSETYLKRTIESILNQSYTNIEYIIIDGGSTDGTIATIKKYEDSITKWVSEPDDGIYDAMNKGIAMSKGEIIYFLNSGDYLYDKSVLYRVATHFLNPRVMGVYGNVEIKDDRGNKRIRGSEVNYNNLLYKRICHQALFVRKKLFNELGEFSTYLKLSSDHEFIVKCIKQYKENFVYFNETIAFYMSGGATHIEMKKAKIEDLKILSSNYDPLRFFIGTAICLAVIVKYNLPRIYKP
ncbi:glycosyltransferase family 2 protein [Methanohalophilus mahii]|uniref:Glycosyl transferase family 2 n=1 Tax=Methanohalophilus mahii (strain ATCC 35705 / DSM 5219 / SLP) TaxID=547558 RepID=D5E8X0_METMS|nr:glycosyltransferase family 2 protein [Methanohalophilus mahii]ADE35629.1 glycosyl transferase family 2 [Methanohalophilus mahii DSM 5219]